MFRLLHMMALRAALLTVLADFKVLAVSEAQVPPRTLAIMIGTSVFSLSFFRLSISHYFLDYTFLCHRKKSCLC